MADFYLTPQNTVYVIIVDNVILVLYLHGQMGPIHIRGGGGALTYFANFD